MEMSPIDGGAAPLPQTDDVGATENNKISDMEEFGKEKPFYSNSSQQQRRLSSKRDVASASFVALAEKLWKPVLAEFLATALYLCTGITTVIDTDAKVFPVAVGHAMLIFMIVASFGPVSGGHVNPVVTLSLFLVGEVSFVRMVLYWIAQVTGSMVGSAVALAINQNMFRYNYTVFRPGSNHYIYSADANTSVLQFEGTTAGQAFVIEVVITLFLMIVVLMTAVDPQGPRQLAPLVIGVAVGAGVLIGFRLSGGSMNPVRSFGPSFVSLDALVHHSEVYRGKSLYYDYYWKDHWVYWLGPTVGAVLASWVYKYILAAKNQVPHASEVRPTRLKPSLARVSRRPSIPAGLLRKMSKFDQQGPEQPQVVRRSSIPAGLCRKMSLFDRQQAESLQTDCDQQRRPSRT